MPEQIYWGGRVPVGTIISLMGTTAPFGYLKCDGTVYNIEDYPVLANYIQDQFGTKNNFGGNGSTTFAVPDLQGEFLRGTGNNSHYDTSLSGSPFQQGSGASVGVHQDATAHPSLGWESDGTTYRFLGLASGNESTFPYKGDNVYVGTRKRARTGVINDMQTMTSDSPRFYYSRPTNTSVLYCICAF